MIYYLEAADCCRLVKPLLGEAQSNVVINGVLNGNNRGKVYVDHREAPRAALVWAENEMFYLVGRYEEAFYSRLEAFIAERIASEALRQGEDCFNLEVYSSEEAHAFVAGRFERKLNRGERIPFVFERERFEADDSGREEKLPDGYRLAEIDSVALATGAGGIIATEIIKFWPSIERFLAKGIGFCVMKDREVVGTCLSVFVSGSEHEIGINTYDPKHRGKGLATAMATAFMRKCLSIGGTPHWTTEQFRKDSIAIARKLGFRQLAGYPVYYLGFHDFV
ncbi:GNAT family N-acetyltransferase [Paenibacillus arenilitoris]|uniref:GNAT family N-acetyltransferase n=1 Tax=Paenibacillus arenilitoris TaxID=2772299 RepID=A0A927CP17_9BACL|nr:GNAT family N-acetyltransferase [Paenibacillus arenilitoris]MBD2869336.1 GNAT family N-acetyltransferase [Paenibacillus arenilitoris]